MILLNDHAIFAHSGTHGKFCLPHVPQSTLREPKFTVDPDCIKTIAAG
jgi:hypothetical protein